MSKKPRHTQPGLMDPPTTATGDRAQQQWQSQLTQVLRTGLGQSKDTSGKFLTWSDLESEGIVTTVPGGSSGGGNHVINPGTGGGGTAPEEDRTPPPVPKNFAASGAMTCIYLTWDNPNLGYDYRIEIHRSAVDDVGTAVLHGSGIGTIYQDVVGSDKTKYFYWGRFVKQLTNEVIIGPWHDTKGAAGQAAEDPGWILDQVEGQIDDTHLNDMLSGEIGKIPVIETGVEENRTQIGNNRDNLTQFEQETAGHLADVREGLTGLGNRITTETTQRETADEALSQTISTVSADLSTETHNRVAAIQAEETARVTQDEALAKNIQQVAADFSSETADITAALKTEETARVNADEALGQRITTVSAELSDETADRIAGIRAEETARVTQDEVLAKRISTVQSGYESADADINASIQTEITARTSADEALGQRIDRTIADYQSEDGKLQGAITSEQTARANADEAIGQRIDAVIADYQGEDSNLQAAITSEQTARVSADEALGKRVDKVVADFESGDTANSAAIQAESEARASADEVLANQITTVRADFTAADLTNSAAIQSEAKARADADSAMASQIDTVEADMNGVKGAVQVNSSAIGTIEDDIVQMRTEYTVKLDVDGYVGGFGLVNDGTVITALWRVDVFGIGAPGKKDLTFAVDGDKVVMDGAFIKNASINDAQIGNLNVDKLIGGTADFVEANIREGSITNAKIGNVIQSGNYQAQKAGWIINKAGFAEFSNIYARGTIEGSIIRGSVIEGGLLIQSDIQITTPTEADAGPGTTRFLSVVTDTEHSVGSTPNNYDSTSADFRIFPADYTASGSDYYGDGETKELVWKEFTRYVPFVISPQIVIRLTAPRSVARATETCYMVIYAKNTADEQVELYQNSFGLNRTHPNGDRVSGSWDITINGGHITATQTYWTSQSCTENGGCSTHHHQTMTAYKVYLNELALDYRGNNLKSIIIRTYITSSQSQNKYRHFKIHTYSITDVLANYV